MKEFKQLGIKLAVKKLVGDHIEIEQILGKEIIVEDFKIEDTKIEKYKRQGCDKCLHLQFEMNGKQHVTFTSGKALLEVMYKLQEGDLPFKTTIVEKSQRFEFT